LIITITTTCLGR